MAQTNEQRRLTVRKRVGSSRKWSEDDILEAMRQAWALMQGKADALTYAKYNELVHEGEVDGPTSVRILQIFGSWQTAADKAGVPAGKKPRRDYASKWTDDEILADIRRYLADPNTRGSFAGWDPWRREHAPTAPSGAMLRVRMGQWSDLKARALHLTAE